MQVIDGVGADGVAGGGAVGVGTGGSALKLLCIAERFDVRLRLYVVRPMTLGFATKEILGLITHGPLDQAKSNRCV